MRIAPPAPGPATPISVSSGGHTSPTAIVCAALLLALVFLVLRIAGAVASPSFSDCSSVGDSFQPHKIRAG
jgi:hypothetical protein